MSEYVAGHVKRNPETGEVAVRTVFPTDNPRLARLEWVIASTNIGARNAYGDEVAGWDDLFVPEPVVEDVVELEEVVE